MSVNTPSKSLANNKFEMIFDFTKDETGAKLNFSLLDPHIINIMRKSVDGDSNEPVVAFPYPKRYGGQLDDAVSYEKKEDNMTAFGFNVS